MGRIIKWEDNGKVKRETWKVSYQREGLPCRLNIDKTTERNSEEKIEISIEDCRHGQENKPYLIGKALISGKGG